MLSLMLLMLVPAFWIMQVLVEQAEQPISTSNAAAIQAGIAATARPRHLIEQYFLEHGYFPLSNAQAGLSQPESYSRDALRRATVGRQGSLELIFDQRSGRFGGQVLMTPEFKNARGGMIWHVQTSNLKGLERYLPGCSYIRVH